MTWLNSIIAGGFITMGFTISMMVTELSNKVFGALAFTLGLFCVIWFSGSLYTSEIYKRYKQKGFWKGISTVWLGNLIGALIVGTALKFSITVPVETARTIAEHKLHQDILPMFVSAIFANVMVCLSIWAFYKTQQNFVILIVIGSFVIYGFQHSIANMGLFTLASVTDWKLIVTNIVVATLGNLVGGVLVAAYKELRDKELASLTH